MSIEPPPHHHRRRTRPSPRVLVGAGVGLLVLVGATAYALTRGEPTITVAGSPTSSSTSSAPSSSGATPSSSPTPSIPASSALPTAAQPPPAATRSAKKGVSAWYMPGISTALGDVRASWYYTWAASRGNVTGPAGVEFVPMIWGAGSVTVSTLDQVRGSGPLLGFNEPDLKEQSNLTVAAALDLWPRLQETGRRLGSPAPAYGAADAGSWFDQFMAGATQRGYRVDFIALHWYGSDFGPNAVNQLRGYLQATYNRYHKPIWLTEYALINFGGGSKYPTTEQQVAFASASVAMLEGLSFVERYAWFALPATDGSGTGLYRPDGTPNAIGTAYRSAVG